MQQYEPNSTEKNPWEHVTTGLIISLTLGLAPFVPEPHIWGKLRWIWGGAQGMKMVDWFDFLMHGAPWAYFLGALVYATFVTLRPPATLQNLNK